PTHANRAARRVVEARDEPRQRRLATSGPTQQADDLARLELEREVAQHQLVVAVAKPNARELDGQRHATRQRRATTDVEPSPSREQLADPAQARHCPLEILNLAGKALDWPGEQLGVAEDQVDRADGDLAPEEGRGAQREPDGRRDREE